MKETNRNEIIQSIIDKKSNNEEEIIQNKNAELNYK
jgi:hypothetical protein